MAYDADEMVAYKGSMITKGVIFHKVKSLGWTTRLFGALTDDEVVKVLEHRQTPAQMGKNASVTFDPKEIIDLNNEEGSVPEIMHGAAPSIDEGPIAPGGRPIGESGVTLAGAPPIQPVAPAQPVSAKHLRPVDPTRPTAPTSIPGPVAGLPLPPPVPQRPVNIKPPRTDHKKLQSMLEAAYALAQNESTYSTAKTLIQANGLERPFQALHTELYSKLFGRLDTTPDSRCRGGIVLDIEVEADNGYIHIITTAGTITVTGQQLAHESIIEAIKLSKDVLPKFTAFEMARVMGVPVKYLLRSIQANFKNFKFDIEKNITGLDSTNQLQNINSNEVWGWYLKNVIDGKPEACLTINDQTRLMAALNARLKWDLQFGLVTATFASQELSGTDVRNRVASVYSSEIAQRLVKLCTVSGSGQIPDRYVFGVILTEDEIAARKLGSFPLYSPEWAMEMMMGEVDWVDVEVPDIYEVTTLPFSNNQPGGHTPQPAEPGRGSPPSDTDEKILAGAGGSKPPIPGVVQRARRTREQIDADLKKMVDDLSGRGMFAQDEIDSVAKAKTIGAAELAYKGLIANAEAVLAKEAKATDQQLGGTFSTPMDDSKPTRSIEPVAPGEKFIPNVAAQTQQHVPPALNSAPAPRVTMPKLSDLEKVPNIKESIREDAGMPAPPATSTAAPVAPPIMAQMGFQHQVPPVANPPAAGASASAEDLLNSLLKATGQG